jgi:hypothetical protein
MKTKIFFLALALVSFFNANANIWRVNNDPTKGADYTSLQACIDNTSTFNGDYIHLEPSLTPYAATVINKRVFIMGNGYFLTGVGSNAGLQDNTQTSIILGLTYIKGTAGTTNSGGANGFIAGCVINNLTLNGISGLTVSKCLIGNLTFNEYDSDTATKISIARNFITGNVSSTNFTGTPSVEVFFENNIFSSETGFSNGTQSMILNPTMKGLFRNNIWNVANANISISNFYTTNNIFSQVNAGIANTSFNNIFKNNLFVTTTPGGGIVTATAGNVTGVVASSIFTTNFATGTGDARFQLIVGGAANPNPAFRTGETIGAVITPSCGAFGATNPYELSGIPNRPTIYSITIPSSVAAGATTMQATISTRSNGGATSFGSVSF